MLTKIISIQSNVFFYSIVFFLLSDKIYQHKSYSFSKHQKQRCVLLALLNNYGFLCNVAEILKFMISKNAVINLYFDTQWCLSKRISCFSLSNIFFFKTQKERIGYAESRQNFSKSSLFQSRIFRSYSD